MASKIGEVEVDTPLLAGPLKGHVYVAAPKCGGTSQPECTEASATNGELYGLYLEAEGFGVIVKLAGKVEVGGEGHHNDLAPGQISTTFEETPQLPFSDLQVKLYCFGGPRVPLANPASLWLVRC